MDASHVLLGRPWRYDVDTTHKGRENCYSFTWNKLKIIRLPNKASSIASEVGEKSMLAIAPNSNEFVEDMKESKMCAALIVKGDEQPTEEIPMEIQSLLSDKAYLGSFEISLSRGRPRCPNHRSRAENLESGRSGSQFQLRMDMRGRSS